MKRRIISLCLLLSMLFQTIPVLAAAAESAKVTAGELSLYPGGSGRLAISAENFSGVASLDLYITYDPSVLTVTSYSCGSFLNAAQTSVNTATAGQVKLSTMALNGLSGSGKVLYLYFSVAEDAAPGSYPVCVAVGDAYDTMLAPTAVSGGNGSVTVKEQTQQAPQFQMFGYLPHDQVTMGDVLEYQLCNYWYYSFVSADFTIAYDPALFAVEEVAFRSDYATENAIYSINSAQPGQIRITYASTEPVNNYFMLDVRFQVIGNADTTSTITTTAANIYQEDLMPYLPTTCQSVVSLTKTPEVVDYPDIWLKTQPLIVGQPSEAVLTLQQGAGVAAADFTVTYDPSVLYCTAVAAVEEAAACGGMIVINDNYSNGTIRFSYINMNAYAETDIPLIRITWEPISSPGSHYEAVISGQGVVDPAQGTVTLEYVTASDCIFVKTVIAPTCTEAGCTRYACGCGEFYDEDVTPSTGHSYDAVTTDPTCTEKGFTTYTCHCGDSYISDEIPATGHAYGSGICVNCGEADPDYHPLPTVKPAGFTLSFEDEILVNFYYTISDTASVTGHGMLVFYEAPGEADFAKANAVYPGSDANGSYIATTDGIAAKEMGDDRYYCAYVQLADGTFVYSTLHQYSPKQYAVNMLGRASTSVKQKALCVAMLNYGAAAQEYFGYRTDDLMNAGLTEEQKALVTPFDASLFRGSVAADANKVGVFAATSGFSGKSASVSFEGAFAINYYFLPNAGMDGDLKLYIWTPEAYAAAAQLTADNASGIISMKLQSNGAYWGQVDGIAAKALDDTYYVAGVYTDVDGNTCSTGVMAYSLSKYCLNNARPGKEMEALAAATAMYGYYAKQYFA